MNNYQAIVYPSYRIRMRAEALTARLSLPAVVTDISAEQINIRSSRPLLPKTQIAISMMLDEEVVLEGNVVWIMDLHDDNGHHYYQTGIKTDTILHRNIKAVGLAEKSKLLQEILLKIIERNYN